jgi:hypothetical protein
MSDKPQKEEKMEQTPRLQPIIIQHQGPIFGVRPIQITCKNCQNSVNSDVGSEPGLGAWLAGIFLVLIQW